MNEQFACKVCNNTPDRRCARCKKTLSVSAFGKRGDGRNGGRQSWCKHCFQSPRTVEKHNLFEQGLKRCGLCLKVMPLVDFQERIASKDGRNSACRHCEMKLKTCQHCGETMPLDRFKRRTKPEHYANPVTQRENYCRRCNRKIYMGKNSMRRWHTLARNQRRNGRHRRPASDDTLSAADLRDGVGHPAQCYLCGCDITWGTAELDHVLPKSKANGVMRVENLKWACKRCNRIKHDLTLEELGQHLQKMLDFLSRSTIHVAHLSNQSLRAMQPASKGTT